MSSVTPALRTPSGGGVLPPGQAWCLAAQKQGFAASANVMQARGTGGARSKLSSGSLGEDGEPGPRPGPYLRPQAKRRRKKKDSGGPPARELRRVCCPQILPCGLPASGPDWRPQPTSVVWRNGAWPGTRPLDSVRRVLVRRASPPGRARRTLIETAAGGPRAGRSCPAARTNSELRTRSKNGRTGAFDLARGRSRSKGPRAVLARRAPRQPL